MSDMPKELLEVTARSLYDVDHSAYLTSNELDAGWSDARARYLVLAQAALTVAVPLIREQAFDEGYATALYDTQDKDTSSEKAYFTAVEIRADERKQIIEQISIDGQ